MLDMWYIDLIVYWIKMMETTKYIIGSIPVKRSYSILWTPTNINSYENWEMEWAVRLPSGYIIFLRKLKSSFIYVGIFN